MTKEKMTVHKALCELKIIGNRIEEAKAEPMVCCNRNNNQKIDGLSVDDVKIRYRANYDKLWDLINRREAMKSALTQSNAVTMITVAGNTMSIAMAIDENTNGIKIRREAINDLRYQYADAVDTMNSENGKKLDDKVERYLTATFGGCEKAAKTDDMIKAEEIFRKNNSYDLIDSNDLKNELDRRQSELDALVAELDSAIQVSNAVTTIEFEY